MNKKMIPHGIIITAIVAAAFIAAALTPIKAYSKTSATPAVVNIAKVDFESRTSDADSRMIADNTVPLAASPSESDMNRPLSWIIVATAAIMTGVVFYRDCKDNRAK